MMVDPVRDLQSEFKEKFPTWYLDAGRQATGLHSQIPLPALGSAVYSTPSLKEAYSPPHHPILASRGSITQHSYRLQPDLISTQDRTGKGVIDIATGAVDNALWDMYAKSRKKHLWVVNMTPVCSILCKK